MTTLKDGRFVFIHAERQHLLVEQPSTPAAAGDDASATAPVPSGVTLTPLSAHLLYGGVVYAFALNATQTRIALVCPASSAAAAAASSVSGDYSAAPRAVLRLFSFAKGEVGELLDELVTVMATSAAWVGDRFLALSGATTAAAGSSPAVSPAASATILIEVTKSPTKLRLMRDDKTSVAPTSGPGSLLCDVSVVKQSFRLWDLQRNKPSAESVLPNRKCRHGKARVAVSSSSDGPFAFVANDDWTVHGFYVGRGGVLHAPRPMLTQFESQSASQALQAEVNAAAAEKGTEACGTVRVPLTHEEAPPPRLLVRMLSDTQVLLALAGSPTILQCAFHPTMKEEESWTVVAKMRLPRRLHATAQLVGLAKERCLVYQRTAVPGGEAKEGLAQGSCSYVTLPLEMKAIRKSVVEGDVPTSTATAAEGKGEEAAALNGAADGATPAEEVAPTGGKKKRKRKAKTAASGSEVNGANAPDPASSALPKPPSGNGDGVKAQEGGPMQRAVQRLLVHAGISNKDQVPNAFLREGVAPATGGEEALKTTTAAGNAERGAPQRTPETGKKGGLSSDTLVMAGGAALGVAIGVYVMRRLSLL